MVSFNILAQFVVVFLLPMIPSAFLFYFMPPKRLSNSVQGALFGISVKATGASATYVILCLVAAYVYNLTASRGPTYVDGRFSIQVIGDEDEIPRYFARYGGNIDIEFLTGDNVIERWKGFRIDTSTNQVISDGFRFDQTNENAKVSVRMHPQVKNYKLAVSDDFRLTRNFTMTLTVTSKTGGDFISALEVTAIAYGDQGRTTHATQVLVLDNRTEGDLSLVMFTPIEISHVVGAKIIAKRLSQGERNAIISGWSREQALELDGSDLIKKVESFQNSTAGVGQVIDEDKLEDKELEALFAKSIREPSKQARFMSGLTPRIELGSRGVKAGEALLVVMSVQRKNGTAEPDFSLSPKPERVGRRFLFPTERAVVVVRSDGSLRLDERVGEIQYETSDGRTDRFGDLKRKQLSSSDAVILDLAGIPKNSFLWLPLFWNKK
jgi:hypothetical protein